MKIKVREICFDMDGTIADLYAVDNWLPKLRAEDASPYVEAAPMWDMAELAEVLRAYQSAGGTVTVITWLSKDSSESYKDDVREAKKAWLEAQDFPFDHFHGVQYGATKANSVRKFHNDGDNFLLIDDNAKVRQGWHLGEAIDPTAVDIIEFIKGLY